MKCVAVTSGKGGTGKSCVAAYTGAALARQGYRTLLMELGDSFRSLDLITGVQDQVVFDLLDVLEGRCEAEKALLQTTVPELHLLAAGLRPPWDVTVEQLRGLLRQLGGLYHFIILDGADLRQFPPDIADTVLQVLTPDTLCIRACAQQARDLYDGGVRQLRLVINNVPPKVIPMFGVQDFDDIIDTVGVQLMAVIPASPKLQYSANNARALDEESITVKVFDNLAGRLLGRRHPLLIR